MPRASVAGPLATNEGSETVAAAVPVPARFRWLLYGVMGCALILVLLSLAFGAGRSADSSRLISMGWPASYASVIVTNKIRALWHAAFMAICTGGFLWLYIFSKSRREWVFRVARWCLVLLVAGDAWLLSRIYIKTMPLAAIEENPVISLLKKDMPVHRVALATQDGFYNWWLTYLFPYHGIQTVNITQMPRMPAEYKKFLSTVGRNMLRFWQLCGVGYVLAPGEIMDQLQRDPAARTLFDLAYSYDVEPFPDGMGVRVLPSISMQRTGRHVVLRFKEPGPRYALVAGAESCPDEEALRRLADPATVPFRKILVAPESAANLPSYAGQGIVGRVDLLGYRPGYFHLKCAAPEPALLRVAEKYDSDWRATVDGRPEVVRRIDYLFQGICVPAGEHEVVLKYTPETWLLDIQWAGLLVCLGVVVGLPVRAVWNRLRERAVPVRESA